MAGPLEGIKVLEMASFISGPFAGMLLAQLGADVIKVENPDGGDPFRTWGDNEGEIRPQFAAYNQGKRSLTLNIKHDTGRDIYLRLARQADVLIENFRPGTVERLGIDYETIRRDNPGLIYIAVTGFGADGPYRDRPTYDAIAQAVSGLWSSYVDLDHPEPMGPATADQASAMFAAIGILGALYHRSQTGEGQRLEINMLAASLAFLSEPVANYTLTAEVSDPHSRPRRSQSYGFICQDGLPLAIHLSSPVKFWKSLLRALERPDLDEDPRFNERVARVQNYEPLRDTLGAIFATRPRAEWLQRLEAADVPCAPINTIEEAINDPQTQHLGIMRPMIAPNGRAYSLVGNPTTFTASDPGTASAPPDLGTQTSEVLTELGYDEAAIAALREEGAL